MKSNWYVLQVRANSEAKTAKLIAENLLAHKHSEHLLDLKIPSQKVSTVKKGKKVEVEKKMYPGYIILQINEDESFFEPVCNIILSTENVKKFLGSNNKPAAISEEERATLLQQVEKGKSAQEDIPTFSIGDSVVVRDGGTGGGGFDGFSGAIHKVDNERQMVSITVNILGRETTVDLPFNLVKLT